MRTLLALLPFGPLAVVLATGAAGQEIDTRQAPAPEALAARLAREVAQQEELLLDHLDGLAAVVADELRDEAWAAEREATLTESFAARQGGAEQARIESLDCRRSKCALSLLLPPDPAPEERVFELQAIEQWLSGSQPCGFTFAPSLEGAGPVRAFIDCQG